MWEDTTETHNTDQDKPQMYTKDWNARNKNKTKSWVYYMKQKESKNIYTFGAE